MYVSADETMFTNVTGINDESYGSTLSHHVHADERMVQIKDDSKFLMCNIIQGKPFLHASWKNFHMRGKRVSVR